MSGTLKLTLPITCFIAGLIPFGIITVLDYFELLNLHGGLGTFFLMIIAFTVTPICFTVGFISALRSRDPHRRIGLTLNGLPFAVLLCSVAYDWLMN
jgi:hypothetical protein